MPAESSVRHEELPSFEGLKSRRGVSPADIPAPSISALALLPALGQEGAAALGLVSLALPGHTSWCRDIHPLIISNKAGREFRERKKAVFSADLKAASLILAHMGSFSFLALRFSTIFCLHGACTLRLSRSGSLVLQEEGWVSLC